MTKEDGFFATLRMTVEGLLQKRRGSITPSSKPLTTRG
jgi:hypothetical protein